MQREESKHEKLEREQREREQMRQAVAAYSGPITKCPRGKTSDQHQDFGVAQTLRRASTSWELVVPNRNDVDLRATEVSKGTQCVVVTI